MNRTGRPNIRAESAPAADIENYRNPVNVEVGRRTVKFYPLMKSDVEAIQMKRDALSQDKTVFFSCFSILSTLSFEWLILGEEFVNLPEISQLLIQCGIFLSLIVGFFSLLKWLGNRQSVENYVQGKLDEVEVRQQYDT